MLQWRHVRMNNRVLVALGYRATTVRTLLYEQPRVCANKVLQRTVTRRKQRPLAAN